MFDIAGFVENNDLDLTAVTWMRVRNDPWVQFITDQSVDCANVRGNCDEDNGSNNNNNNNNNTNGGSALFGCLTLISVLVLFILSFICEK